MLIFNYARSFARYRVPPSHYVSIEATHGAREPAIHLLGIQGTISMSFFPFSPHPLHLFSLALITKIKYKHICIAVN